MPRSFVFLLVAAAAAGCAPTLPPAVSVTGTRVLDATDTGVRLAVDLVLENPNDFPLPLERVGYRVAVPDSALAAYAADGVPARTLPALGVQTLTLTAGLAGEPGRWRAGGAAGQAWRVRGDVTYAADRGLRSFLTETGVPLPTAGFRGEGRFADQPQP